MTMRGCPMHRYMTNDAKEKLAKLPGVKTAEVKVVWDPPWNPSMITEDGRKALGGLESNRGDLPRTRSDSPLRVLRVYVLMHKRRVYMSCQYGTEEGIW